MNDETLLGLTGAQYLCLAMLPTSAWIWFRVRKQLAQDVADGMPVGVAPARTGRAPQPSAEAVAAETAPTGRVTHSERPCAVRQAAVPSARWRRMTVACSADAPPRCWRRCASGTSGASGSRTWCRCSATGRAGSRWPCSCSSAPARRRGRPAVTAVSLAGFVGIGQVLATLADRHGRVAVMLAADVARAALFAAMLLPIPVGGLLVLAFLAGLATPPFEAARSAALPDLVPEDRYGEALALAGVSVQSSLVIGYALGGLLLTVVEPESRSRINSMSFLVSAILLLGSATPPPPSRPGCRPASASRSAMVPRRSSRIASSAGPW